MCEVFRGWSRARWCWWISNTLNICQVVEPWMRYSQWEQTLLSSLLLSALWTRSSYACVCTEKGTIVYFPSEHIDTHTHTHKLFSVCNLVIAEPQHEQAVKRFEWKNNLNRHVLSLAFFSFLVVFFSAANQNTNNSDHICVTSRMFDL